MEDPGDGVAEEGYARGGFNLVPGGVGSHDRAVRATNSNGFGQAGVDLSGERANRAFRAHCVGVAFGFPFSNSKFTIAPLARLQNPLVLAVPGEKCLF
jgi:hypothetical protein